MMSSGNKKVINRLGKQVQNISAAVFSSLMNFIALSSVSDPDPHGSSFNWLKKRAKMKKKRSKKPDNWS
jgi:hypothetical protein